MTCPVCLGRIELCFDQRILVQVVISKLILVHIDGHFSWRSGCFLIDDNGSLRRRVGVRRYCMQWALVQRHLRHQLVKVFCRQVESVSELVEVFSDRW